VEKVRKLIIEGILPLCKNTDDGRNIVDPGHPLAVTFADFGASSVDLKLVAWVLVDHKIAFSAQARERIYHVLNENHIEIPFPQQDIYIKGMAKTD
jgi:small-conductance mechanosensitive channel